MVNRSLVRSLDDDSLENELANMFGDSAEELLLDSLEDANKQFDVNQIVEGKIVEINEEFVVVDVGFKSEGAIPKNEWEEGEEPPQVGQMIKVLIEEVEDQNLLRSSQHDRAEQAQGREDHPVGKDDGFGPRRPSRHWYCHPQDQRWFAGRYRRERLLAS